MNEEYADVFDEHRRFLFSIAYRMLGSVVEAEDMVQETFLRWQQSRGEGVESPRAYLATIVTRLCINHLSSARVRREQYVGSWLPEPIITDDSADPAKAICSAESLSVAFLILLESLSPVERAVLLLRDVFDYDYAEIAGMVGRSEANCRQVLSRARRHVSERRARFEPSTQQQEKLMSQFVRAATAGDMNGLLTLLADDITFWSDGGGKAAAALRPIRGRERVARFVISALRRLVPPDRMSRLLEVNGQPGVVNYISRHPHSAVIVDVAEERIRTIYVVSNPDKLEGVAFPDTSPLPSRDAS
ncbi:MAG TPA: RNA polymerase sigma-70 factor [Pyrinomonadaceae bacterium]|nr:RNA polymerase sigma-70 factor [Pyrinomonadaceae bacterium]